MERPEDDSIATRTTLLQRLKDWRDESSWQDFFDTYWKLIFDVAQKSGLNKDEAQEVVQETMISVARSMPGFKYDRTIGSFKTWLMNLTRWRVIDLVRKQKPHRVRRRNAEETAVGTRTVEKMIDPASPALDELWDEEWETHLLGVATTRIKRRLDPQKYQVFDLYVNKDWPPEKVAAVFGITTEQVYLTKHRVTEMIKQEVERLQTGGFDTPQCSP